MRGAALIAVAALCAACVGDGTEVADPVPTLFDDSTSTTDAEVAQSTASTASTTTLPVSARLPLLADDIPGAVRTADGLLLPITGTDGDVWFVIGPCGEDRIEPAGSATLAAAQHVVLDPGGHEGPVAATNLAVAEQTAALLRADGVAVLLTRTAPAEVSAATRGAAGPALGARVFVSIHHGLADGPPTEEPRPTVFHRADDPDSRRLAGLIHEEVAAALAAVGVPFAAHEEPGARPLLNQRGADYFRVLQTSRGVAGVRVELLGSGENETALLVTEEGRDIEARALADAIVRFLISEEEGSGFVDPVEAVRTAPTSNTPGGCG